MSLLFAGVILAILCFEMYSEYMIFAEQELPPSVAVFLLTRPSVVAYSLTHLLVEVLK